jgi:hypothetical protein
MFSAIVLLGAFAVAPPGPADKSRSPVMKAGFLPDDALVVGRAGPFQEGEVVEAEVLALNARTGFAAVKVYTRLADPNAGEDSPLPIDCHYPGMPKQHAKHGVSLVLWPLTDGGAFERADVYPPATTPEECGAKIDNQANLADAKALFAKHELDVRAPPPSIGVIGVTSTDTTPGADVTETTTRFSFHLDGRVLGSVDVHVGMYGTTRVEADGYRDGDKFFLFLTTTHQDMSGTSISFAFAPVSGSAVPALPPRSKKQP